ncbi:MAG: 50S ribosomal protein L21e [Nanoarchaeota archaeon]
MTKRTGKSRRKTRYKFSKKSGEKGKVNIGKYLQSFEEGDKVLLKLDPSVHKGLYFRRHHGKVGVIKRRRGFCYETSVKENNKEKLLIIHPIHLTKVSRNVNK